MLKAALLIIVSILVSFATSQGFFDIITPEGNDSPNNSLTTPPSVTTTSASPGPLQNTTQQNTCSIGECVPVNFCTKGPNITDGSGVIPIFARVGGTDPPAETCPKFLEVCCEKRSDTKIVPTKKPREGCGYRNDGGVSIRIADENENETQFGELPWMVAVISKMDVLGRSSVVFECGGSLISPSVVLTSAHNIQRLEAKNLMIRVGEWNTQDTSEVLPHQERQVSEIIFHDKFHSRAFHNDIALLLLDTPIEYADHINTICLPPSDFQFEQSRCFASGWGQKKFDEGESPVILKKVELPIVPNFVCQSALRKTKELGPQFVLDSSFTCAGGEKDKDTCKGDGGSPLVCPIPGTINRYYQVGIVSWGVYCGNELPAVYANVPYLRNWIDQQLERRNIGNESYSV